MFPARGIRDRGAAALFEFGEHLPVLVLDGLLLALPLGLEALLLLLSACSSIGASRATAKGLPHRRAMSVFGALDL